ncbi:hypothetical protein BV20DRAFT_619805 [Pilatotrama ljubarskyi]|nr:hypothetical protein BV20DRAFT_619805 [Pilatotrama ljubarskyi]
MGAPESIPHQLRPAGIAEIYRHTFTRLGIDSCVLVAAKYESSTGRPLDKPTLFCALEEVVSEHAELSARMIGDVVKSGPRSLTWIRLPSLDLNQIVEFRDADSQDLESIFETLFLQPFDLEAHLPLWKLVVLSDNTVILVYDHIMGDGQSGLAFHLSLLAALQRVREPGVHSGTIAGCHDLPLNPPVEEAIKVTLPLCTLFHEVNQAINPFSRRRRAAPWTGNPVPSAFTLGAHVRNVHLSSEETSRLVRRCRVYGATVTGAIYALIAYILARLLEARREGVSALTIHVPVSLRPYSGAAPTAICNHVSFFEDVYKLIPPSPGSPYLYPSLAGFPWADAASFSDTLRREAPRSQAMIGLMKTLIGENPESYLLGKLGQKRGATVLISNLGPVRQPQAPFRLGSEKSASPWDIQEMTFAQADGTSGVALKINVIGTPSGALGISLTWGKEALDEVFANECAVAFSEGMRELVSIRNSS